MKDYEEIMNSAKYNIETQIYRAYQQGYEEGRNNTEYMVSSAYKHGMEESWEAARKLMISSSEGGLEPDIIAEIFDGLSYYMVLKDVSASEAIAKIKEYEEQQKQDIEIKVGDEVYQLDKNNPRVVTSIYNEGDEVNAVQITGNGKIAVNDVKELHRTGRTFPQIAEVLNEMRGNNK